MVAACPKCKSTDTDYANDGRMVCTNCGNVLEEVSIVSEVGFQENANGSASLSGTIVGASGKSFRSGPGYSRESRELTIENGRKKIQQLASQLKLNQHHIEAAHRLFMLAVQHNFIQGRKTGNVCAACMYIVCRREKTPHMLIDFSEVLQINVYVLGHTFLQFCRLLNLQLPIIDPSLYIQRFASRLEFDKETDAVANTALKIVARMKRDWILTGRRPSGICGAGLLIAARMHGFNRTMADVVKVVRICDVTLRKRLVEFSETPTSSLTVEEFEKGVLEMEAPECDPPAFTRARALDEKIQRRAEAEARGENWEEIEEAERQAKRKNKKKRKKQDTDDEEDEEETEEEDSDVETAKKAKKAKKGKKQTKKKTTKKGKGKKNTKEESEGEGKDADDAADKKGKKRKRGDKAKVGEEQEETGEEDADNEDGKKKKGKAKDVKGKGKKKKGKRVLKIKGDVDAELTKEVESNLPLMEELDLSKPAGYTFRTEEETTEAPTLSASSPSTPPPPPSPSSLSTPIPSTTPSSPPLLLLTSPSSPLPSTPSSALITTAIPPEPNNAVLDVMGEGGGEDLDEEEDFSDIKDSDIMGYLVSNEDEILVRTQIWTELNREFLDDQEAKKKSEEELRAQGKVPVKRQKRKNAGKRDAETAAEATAEALKKSAKINQQALETLFSNTDKVFDEVTKESNTIQEVAPNDSFRDEFDD